MSKLDTVQRELCRKLGDEYRIMRIDYEKVIYRDFGNGFNVEISGTHTTSEKKKATIYKTLHITIPEDLDYTEVFEDLFAAYTTACELIQVKTTNMGSLFKLTYDITLRDAGKEKEMIDKLRCRNGNLEISVSRQETVASGL